MRIYRHGDGCPDVPTYERDPETHRIIMPVPYINVYRCPVCNAVFWIDANQAEEIHCPCCENEEFGEGPILSEIDGRRYDLRRIIREAIDE